MSTTYRAAYLPNGAGTVLTRPEHAGLTDEALKAEALAEALRADLIDSDATDASAAAPRMTRADFDDALIIGDWAE